MIARGFAISEPEPSDCAALSQLAMESKMSWGYPATCSELWRDMLTLDANRLARGYYLMARDNDTYAGVIGAEFGRLPISSPGISDNGWQLEFCFVLPDQQGNGLGRILMELLIDRWFSIGRDPIYIESDPNAIGFYEKLGAVTIGNVPSTLIPGRSLPLLVLHPGAAPPAVQESSSSDSTTTSG